MMNFYHEIECPDKRELRGFLWVDYFHDSSIMKIDFNEEKHVLNMDVLCDTDFEQMYDIKIDENEKLMRCIYNLKFEGILYFSMQRHFECGDWINGRFKNSARLKNLQCKSKVCIYHYRIQLADGYCDIIFKRFSIHKKLGNIKYKDWQFKAYNRYGTAKSYIFDDCLQKALNGDDFDRFYAMEELYNNNAKEVYEIAKKNILIEDNDDSSAISAYIIGKMGNKADIGLLIEYYKQILKKENFLLLRNAMDSIELCIERE